MGAAGDFARQRDRICKPALLLRAVAIFACLAAAGCISRPDSGALAIVNAAPEASTADVFVATTRARAADGEAFTSMRAPGLNFGRYKISIPPNHTPAAIEWPSATPADAKTSFAAIDRSNFDEKSFLAAVDRAAAAKGGQAMIFVHGYNTGFAEALFRVAQLDHDRGVSVVSVLFAWPSKGELTGYVADRDSAAYSRDYLEKLLGDVERLPHVRSVTLAAHSLGSWLAIEALRQSRIRGRQLPKLNDVILAAADIDVELFQTQLAAIGKLHHPITLLTAQDDGALAFSRRIGGNVDRVGLAAINEPRVAEAVKKFGVRLIDVTSAPAQSSVNHDRYVSSVPVLAKLLMGGAGEGGPPPGDLAPGIYVLDVTSKSLENK
ncbi:alpha/beta hydrolase [Terrarubrum flagellatum]|uniref:alpha/beta hydrolase n=1 Tax=Terrirubrum flagellatum TaxID=2895980 RepID=UPI0031452F85